ncbi:hypothetical protein EDC14_101731 [Hydrogenispora ethanolica]|jgi:hypothetical protein|uniref:Uncharacterized protein n=1 Tax=Hydrogenispora ethanolica TaxID=1082276 RepID=A0A4R1RGX1_HYDET|nr:hypothetical protein [Hydrogenispora ethanolica]TCL65283.1 hypothetical protein EDC14_101731 [Hydrogenispora ethanolica]
MFEIITVIVVLGIFSLFAYTASKAEKAVALKLKAKQVATNVKLTEKAAKRAR